MNGYDKALQLFVHNLRAKHALECSKKCASEIGSIISKYSVVCMVTLKY